jgi:hypothetical protein
MRHNGIGNRDCMVQKDLLTAQRVGRNEAAYHANRALKHTHGSILALRKEGNSTCELKKQENKVQ